MIPRAGAGNVETPMYRATVVMIYQPPMVPGTPFFITPAQPAPQAAPPPFVNPDTRFSNPAVVARAERILGGPPRLPYQLSSELVGGAATSAYNGAYSARLNISVTSPSAAESAAVANAYGRAFVEWRRDQQLAQIANAQKVIRERLKTFSSPQSRRSPDYFALKARLQDLAKAAQAVTGDYVTVVPASAPAGPYAPRPKSAAVVGLLGGLVGGIALALVLETFSARPRGRRAVSDSSGTLGSSVTP
jgi:capsular polysaccharide biosynthesis protein